MDHLVKKNTESLVKNVLDQAKYFLENADEFYPFGAVIDKNEKLKPISVFLDNEFPDSTEVLNSLEDGIKKGIKAKDYLSAAICIDIYINVNEGSTIQKKSAVEIRVYDENSYTTHHFLYQKENKTYNFSPWG